jgi:hypothetical protein
MTKHVIAARQNSELAVQRQGIFEAYSAAFFFGLRGGCRGVLELARRAKVAIPALKVGAGDGFEGFGSG